MRIENNPRATCGETASALKKLPPEARESFEATAGETPEATLKRLLETKPGELASWFSLARGSVPCSTGRPTADNPRFMPISHHDDQVVGVTRGYGDAQARRLPR